MTVDTSHQTYFRYAAYRGINAGKTSPFEYRRKASSAMDRRGTTSSARSWHRSWHHELAKMSSKPSASGRSASWKACRARVFDWVDRVSIGGDADAVDLVRLPVRGAADPTAGPTSARQHRAGTEIDSEEKRDAVLQEMPPPLLRRGLEDPPEAAAESDLISMLAHGEATRRPAVAAAGVHGTCCC